MNYSLFKKTKKKGSFLLPEVLLSLLLVSLAGIPLLHFHSRLYRFSQKQAVNMQLQVAASNCLIDTGLLLRKGAAKGISDGELNPIEVFVTGCKRQYKVHYQIVEKEKIFFMNGSGEMSLVNIKVELSPRQGKSFILSKALCVVLP
ncbi:hypothetical protein CLAVI_000180 [Candidatus Clavichlamydia salmonicola]|uniref:hypothetical protein n=1 Tax=Candidatus Clavichlamydia salmonicola TaxID=469812 RepID=UPI001891B0D2|nr:hypothetical protein [Candidatus Clavichlamydia salmonicola]MBF5050569.1 hypothetical protein [Candidatus Clavichlamydia salmonicola]